MVYINKDVAYNTVCVTDKHHLTHQVRLTNACNYNRN